MLLYIYGTKNQLAHSQNVLILLARTRTKVLVARARARIQSLHTHTHTYAPRILFSPMFQSAPWPQPAQSSETDSPPVWSRSLCAGSATPCSLWQTVNIKAQEVSGGWVYTFYGGHMFARFYI